MELENIIVAITDPTSVVRDPISKLRIGTEGLKVKKTPFWLRRIKDKDVIILKEILTKTNIESQGEQNNDNTI